ncbi:uracil-DNA glycosylase family protein [Geomonas sp. Red276]
MSEQESLVASLKRYLEDLAESGMDEIPYGEASVTAPLAVARPVTPEPSPGVSTAASAGPAARAPEGVCAGDERASAAASASATAPAPVEGAIPIKAEGPPKSRLVLVMAGDGFAGEAGSLLAKIVGAMGIPQDQVLLLSYPRGDAGDELRSALLARLSAASAECIVVLGEEAAQLMMKSGNSLESLRGRFRSLGGVPLMATLHPEELVADEGLKRGVWNEMKQVMARLGS